MSNAVRSMKVKWHYAFVQLSEIIIFLGMPEEHIHHIGQKSALLYEVGVKLNLEKCKCFTNPIKYLGHAIHRGRFKVSTQATDPIA